MKIELINENQIRCTLTSEDLAAREIKLSELALGSEKTRMLFRDMMQQAFVDFGFSADNTPLIIEAVPTLNALILNITKVDDPEEMENRLPRSSESVFGDAFASGSFSLSGIDDILSLMSKLSEVRKAALGNRSSDVSDAFDSLISPVIPGDLTGSSDAPSEDDVPGNGKENEKEEPLSLSRFYLFREMESVIRAAHVVDESYRGENSLYKNPDDGNFYLILSMDGGDGEQFNRVCNVLSEYSVPVDYIPGIQQLFAEHMDTIISKDALLKLRDI